MKCREKVKEDESIVKCKDSADGKDRCFGEMCEERNKVVWDEMR